MPTERSAAIPARLAICLLAALALAGCVGAGTSSAPAAPSGLPGQAGISEPAQTPVGPPVLVSPPPGAMGLQSASPSRPVSVAGASGTESVTSTVAVTMADNGKTVHLAVGQRLSLSLSNGVIWSLKVSDGSVIRQVAVPMPTGIDGLYQAVGAGMSTLGGAGRPDCSGGGFCPMFLLQFTVTIVVS